MASDGGVASFMDSDFRKRLIRSMGLVASKIGPDPPSVPFLLFLLVLVHGINLSNRSLHSQKECRDKGQNNGRGTRRHQRRNRAAMLIVTFG